MDLGLQGRVAIVAAASKGLGRAVAEELAREGAQVAICSRETNSIEQTAAAIQALSALATLGSDSGAALLTASLHGLRASGMWAGERGDNLLDGGAPFYDTYETADGKYVAVGAIEMRFWADLVKVLGLAADDLPVHVDNSEWPRLRKVLTEAIGKYTRDELVARAEGTDACLTPVLSPWEAAEHPHNAARGTFVDIGGVVQPAPAPRFGRTPPETPEPPHEKGADTAEVLSEYGLDGPEIERLKESGVVS